MVAFYPTPTQIVKMDKKGQNPISTVRIKTMLEYYKISKYSI